MGFLKFAKNHSKKQGGAFDAYGNFLTYVNSAQTPNRFGEDERIGIVSRRNMQKIRRFLKKDYAKPN